MTYSDTTATFTPTTALDYNKTYTATITTGAKDLLGNALEDDYSWSFTTQSEPPTDGEPPSDGAEDTEGGEDTGAGGGGGCFIATAAYGSQMVPQLKVLREFRDRFLLANNVGRSFVGLDYTYSPPIARFMAKYDSLRAIVRLSLLPLAGMSWAVLNVGPVTILASMILFSAGLVGLGGLRRTCRKS